MKRYLISITVLVLISFAGFSRAEEPSKEFKDPTTGMGFVFVKGGCFQMGGTFGDGHSNEKPVHEACVDDIYMGKYEVTQKEWVAIMGSNPSRFRGKGA